jgi:hypothetical protein
MIPWTTSVISGLAGAVLTIYTAGAAGAEELSYHGWSGSADFEGSRFIGCHSIRRPQ